MKIIVIGAVAAGTSAAAKARRCSEDAQITIYEQGQHISYSGCGMPYAIGGEVADINSLTPRDPAFFRSKYNVDIKTGHQVLAIDPKSKTVRIRETANGHEFTDSYDRLIMATGARAFIPPLREELSPQQNVHVLRSIDDMLRIQAWLKQHKPASALIIGSGFIGLEMAENLTRRGLKVSLVEQLDQVAPMLDADMACYVQKQLEVKGVSVQTGRTLTSLPDDGSADMVLIAAGVRPNTELASAAGLELGKTGAIKVDVQMRTSDPDIFACGDCAEQFHAITGQPVYFPLGSTANKTGRIAGANACLQGEPTAAHSASFSFRGVLGTGIFRVFDMTVAHTGLNERQALEAGYSVAVCHNTKPDHSEYLGGQNMTIKGIACQATGRLLGAQIIGGAGVDKRIDVLATAISLGASVTDLTHLDLAYAPPFSTTKDPVMYAGMALDNAINHGRPLITPQQLDAIAADPAIAGALQLTIVDARIAEQYEKQHVPAAVNLPHADVRRALAEGALPHSHADDSHVFITYCNKGTTGNAVQNILINRGYRKVYNISGGHSHYQSGQ